MSGYLVDHESRQILAHQESDLRNNQQLRGWADAVMMRFDPAVLPHLRQTGHHQTVFGATFTRYLAQDQTREGVMEVWWNDALLLPLRLTVRQRGAVVTSTIAKLTSPGTLSVLADPRTRFREYEMLDVTDSRERSH